MPLGVRHFSRLVAVAAIAVGGACSKAPVMRPTDFFSSFVDTGLRAPVQLRDLPLGRPALTLDDARDEGVFAVLLRAADRGGNTIDSLMSTLGGTSSLSAANPHMWRNFLHPKPDPERWTR